jgi:hypothetical protein
MPSCEKPCCKTCGRRRVNSADYWFSIFPRLSVLFMSSHRLLFAWPSACEQPWRPRRGFERRSSPYLCRWKASPFANAYLGACESPQRHFTPAIRFVVNSRLKRSLKSEVTPMSDGPKPASPTARPLKRAATACCRGGSGLGRRVLGFRDALGSRASCGASKR